MAADAPSVCVPVASHGKGAPRRGLARMARHDVRTSALLAFLLATAVTIAGLVFMVAEQAAVLTDVLRHGRAGLGDAAGSLVLADEVLSLVLSPVWGALSDRIGRRAVMASGLFLMAAATASSPWALCAFPDTRTLFTLARSLLNSMLAARLLFAAGGCAATAMVTALMGDYAADGCRTRLAGMAGVSSALGALFAACVLSRLPVLLNNTALASSPLLSAAPSGGRGLVVAFSATALIECLSAVVALFFLAPKQRKSPSSGTIQKDTPPSIPARIWNGIRAAKRPAVLLAYASGFVARADSVVMHQFVPLWTHTHMTATGQCAPGDADAFAQCVPARRLASAIRGTANVAVLLGAPVFGIACERLGPVNAVALPAIIGLLAHGTLAMLRSPEPGFLLYAAAVGAGLANIGMVIASMALMSSVSPRENRGALAGAFSACGALGIIATAKLGGLLFDHAFPSAPFLVVAAASLVLLLLHIRVRLAPTQTPDSSSLSGR